MLKKILCISGKPGLYELLRYNKNMVIVENLSDKKRGPVFASERIISLGDIAIYTTSEEVPLASVFEAIKDKNNAQPVDMSEVKTNEQLAALMTGVLPNYDTDRVHASDVKKVLHWYNVLLQADKLTPTEEEKEQSAGSGQQAAVEEVKAEKPKAEPKTKKAAAPKAATKAAPKAAAKPKATTKRTTTGKKSV